MINPKPSFLLMSSRTTTVVGEITHWLPNSFILIKMDPAPDYKDRLPPVTRCYHLTELGPGAVFFHSRTELELWVADMMRDDNKSTKRH